MAKNKWRRPFDLRKAATLGHVGGPVKRLNPFRSDMKFKGVPWVWSNFKIPIAGSGGGGSPGGGAYTFNEYKGPGWRWNSVAPPTEEDIEWIFEDAIPCTSLACADGYHCRTELYVKNAPEIGADLDWHPGSEKEYLGLVALMVEFTDDGLPYKYGVLAVLARCVCGKQSSPSGCWL